MTPAVDDDILKQTLWDDKGKSPRRIGSLLPFNSIGSCQQILDSELLLRDYPKRFFRIDKTER
jgi:hypothetical protein